MAGPGDVELAGPSHAPPDMGYLEEDGFTERTGWSSRVRRPQKDCLLAVAGGSAVFLLLFLLLFRFNGDPAPAACLPAEDTTAPEGVIRGNFAEQHDFRGRPRMVAARQGIVAADHGRCSDIGMSMLRAGGNAVDAAVSTALCQGVLNPMASGLGGGHFMLIRLPNRTSEVIDAREVAPVAATEAMYQGHPEWAVTGGLAVAVPLELKGLHLAHSRHGRLPWSQLVEPCIPLAEHGFPAHPYLVAALAGSSQAAMLGEHPALRDAFLIKTRSGWRAPRVNETCCRRPALAQLLREISSRGPGALYSAPRAQQLVDDVRRQGGILSVEDLRLAAPLVKPALTARVFGVDVTTVPPPSSGATIITALEVLAGYRLPLAGSGALGAHRLVEALKHAFALRMSLGDPGPDAAAPFVDMGAVLADMGSSGFADQLRASIDDAAVLPLERYGGRWNVLEGGAHPEDHGTSHISVVDKDRCRPQLLRPHPSNCGCVVAC